MIFLKSQVEFPREPRLKILTLDPNWTSYLPRGSFLCSQNTALGSEHLPVGCRRLVCKLGGLWLILLREPFNLNNNQQDFKEIWANFLEVYD